MLAATDKQPTAQTPSAQPTYQVLHQVAARHRLALVDGLARERQEAVGEEGGEEGADDADHREETGDVGGLSSVGVLGCGGGVEGCAFGRKSRA